MAETIFIGVAWPYANGPLHLGHIAGAYLPPDIFARYHRARGNRVLMVSGSDQHGTPITVRAEEEGLAPQAIVERYHRQFLDCWQRLGISFDLFTTTGTDNHRQVVQEIFLRLLEGSHIYRDTTPLPYCPRDRRFLPDRYMGGTCPYCGYGEARGDQCESCGKPLGALELLAPRCRLCGGPPEVRESEHFFLRLSAFAQPLRAWLEAKGHWRKPVLNWTLGLLNEGLQDRAITRDIDWGVPIPLAGYDSKRIYVWFEAVIGYLSAAKEWAQGRGEPEAWRELWQNPQARGYYFIGKDNIPFHTLIWPAILMAYGGLELPYDVPANQYLTMSGAKASTSRGWAIWLPDYLARYDPDPLRYYLAANMPEAADTDFTWADFVRRNNDELVATWGNLAHRVLAFTYRQCGGRVPEPGELREEERALLARAEATLGQVGEEISRCRFRAGLAAAMALAQEANRYLDYQAPWSAIRRERQAAERSLYAALGVIAALKTCLYPYLPFSSQELHRLLGFPGGVESAGWQVLLPAPGQPLAEPKPLFRKLEPQVVAEEEARLSPKATRLGEGQPTQ